MDFFQNGWSKQVQDPQWSIQTSKHPKDPIQHHKFNAGDTMWEGTYKCGQSSTGVLHLWCFPGLHIVKFENETIDFDMCRHVKSSRRSISLTYFYCKN